MQMHNRHYYSFILTILFFLLSLLSGSSADAAAQDLVRSYCSHARYPALCLQTLSTLSAAPSTITPWHLAQAALTATLSRARSLSAYLTALNSSQQLAAPTNKRQRAAVSDCALQMSDSVDQLARTLREVQRMRAGTASFEWHMSNAQTWASAALTDCSTCVDGLKEGGSDGKVRLEVKRRVNGVGMLASNALYLIARLGFTHNNNTTN